MLDWELEPENYIQDKQVDYIEQLLQTACISQEEKDEIERLLFSYSESEAQTIIERLQEAQVNPIEAGNNYSQSDIVKQINKIIK